MKKINMVQQTVFTVHALLVGSDWAAPSYEFMLRKFVKDNALESTVHFVNKSLEVVPYLAASDVLVQNSQVLYIPYYKSLVVSRICLVFKFLRMSLGFGILYFLILWKISCEVGPNEAYSSVIMETNRPLNYRINCWQLYFIALNSLDYTISAIEQSSICAKRQEKKSH